MKKGLLFMALAGVMAFATSCNKSDNRTLYAAWGSREYSGDLVLSDGTKLDPVVGRNQIPSMDSDLERSRMRIFYYQMQEDATKGVGDTEEIEVYYFEYLATQDFSLTGMAPKDDPIMLPSLDLNYTESTMIWELKPGISVTLNYLDMMVWHLKYTENAGKDDDYSRISTYLEIDPVIVPGEKNDTINMALKFDNNIGDKETIKNAYGPFTVWRSFDLTHAAGELGFPVTNGDQNITYIIKMTYKTFEDIKLPDYDKVVEKFLTTEWTPGRLYSE